MDSESLMLLPPGLVLGIAFLLGACIGSFLTMVTYRLPRDERIGATRSRCPSCFATLTARDLIPVFSWVLCIGHCRHCKAQVHWRYPATELACAIGTALIAWHYGASWQALAVVGLWWGVVAIFITDLEHYIILDEVQIALTAIGLFYGVLMDVPVIEMAFSGLAGAAIGLALKYGFLYFRNKDGLGMGDVKFLAVAGVWLGDSASFVPFLFFSGLMGIVSGLAWRAFGNGERFPFGPALAASLLLCIVFPPAAQKFWTLYGMLS